jgi:HK97 family phage portal protein
MHIFGFDIKIADRRNSLAPTNPLDDRWYYPVSGGTQSGIDVDPDTAMRYSTVFSCVKIIAETIGSIPLIAYKRVGEGGKARATNHAVYNLIRNRPNLRSTAMGFRETITMHYLLHGNGYAEIERDYGGDPVGLRLLHPYNVESSIDSDTGFPYYSLNLGNGRSRIIPFWDMFHLQGFTLDGSMNGLSMISFMREAIALGLAAEAYGAAFLSNNATPAGVIQLAADQELSDPARKRLREEWQRRYGGVSKAGSTAILEEGMEWKPIGIPQQDAQWIENRKFQTTEICRFFRMPPHLVADLDRSTNNNIEQQSLEFLTYTMLAHFVRWEQTIQRDLFNASSSPNSKFSDKYFAEFLINALARGDLKTRYSAYAIGRQWGWLSVNDIREMENMNPIGEEGDIYLSPLNMVDSKNFGDVSNDNLTKTLPDDSADSEEIQKKSVKLLKVVTRNRPALPAPPDKKESFQEMIRESVGRLLRKEERFSFRKGRTQGEIVQFKNDHDAFILETLRPMTRSFLEHQRLVKIFNEGEDALSDEKAATSTEQILERFLSDYRSKLVDNWSEHIDELSQSLTETLMKSVESVI